MAGKVVGVYFPVDRLDLLERLEVQAIRLGFIRDNKPQPGPLCVFLVGSVIEDMEKMSDEDAQEMRERLSGFVDEMEPSAEGGDDGDVHSDAEGEPAGEAQAGSEAPPDTDGDGGPQPAENQQMEQGGGEPDPQDAGEAAPESDGQGSDEPAAPSSSKANARSATVVLSHPKRKTSVPSEKPAPGGTGKKKGR